MIGRSNHVTTEALAKPVEPSPILPEFKTLLDDFPYGSDASTWPLSGFDSLPFDGNDGYGGGNVLADPYGGLSPYSYIMDVASNFCDEAGEGGERRGGGRGCEETMDEQLEILSELLMTRGDDDGEEYRQNTEWIDFGAAVYREPDVTKRAEEGFNVKGLNQGLSAFSNDQSWRQCAVLSLPTITPSAVGLESIASMLVRDTSSDGDKKPSYAMLEPITTPYSVADQCLQHTRQPSHQLQKLSDSNNNNFCLTTSNTQFLCDGNRSKVLTLVDGRAGWLEHQGWTGNKLEEGLGGEIVLGHEKQFWSNGMLDQSGLAARLPLLRISNGVQPVKNKNYSTTAESAEAAQQPSSTDVRQRSFISNSNQTTGSANHGHAKRVCPLLTVPNQSANISRFQGRGDTSLAFVGVGKTMTTAESPSVSLILQPQQTDGGFMVCSNNGGSRSSHGGNFTGVKIEGSRDDYETVNITDTEDGLGEYCDERMRQLFDVDDESWMQNDVSSMQFLSEHVDTNKTNDKCQRWISRSNASDQLSDDHELANQYPSPSSSSSSSSSPTTSRRGNKSICLWQFLKELLLLPQSYQSWIRWLDQNKGIFKIVDSGFVARLWGERKNRPAMNYDKLSRSIRQYYRKGIIQKTSSSKRLVYQFCPQYL